MEAGLKIILDGWIRWKSTLKSTPFERVDLGRGYVSSPPNPPTNSTLAGWRVV
jgi:hypothetical protein